MAHSCYNYERLQGIGFLHAMAPIINDIYDKDDVEGRTEALQRHTAFFNTEPRLGSMIVGLCAAMEERIASGEKELAGEGRHGFYQIWSDGSHFRNRRYFYPGDSVSAASVHGPWSCHRWQPS